MKARSKSVLVCLTIVLAVGGVYVWRVFYPSVGSDVVCLDLDIRYALDTVLEARVDHNTDNLLLRFRHHREGLTRFYEYRKEERRFRAISSGVWDEAKSGIWSVYRWSRASYLPDPPQIKDGVLWYRDSTRSTAGRTALQQVIGPRGKVVAVLSAAGWERPSIDGLMPIGGDWGGGYAGQHYLEFFTLPELRPLGSPVRIPLTTAEGFGEAFFSSDDKYFVCAGIYGAPVCVIPTEIEELE